MLSSQLKYVYLILNFFPKGRNLSLQPLLQHEYNGNMAYISIGAPVFTLIQEVIGFLGGLVGKESTCNAGDLGLIPGLGRSLGEGNGYPLQCSCLENPMDTGAWRTTVHGVTQARTRLSAFHFSGGLRAQDST